VRDCAVSATLVFLPLNFPLERIKANIESWTFELRVGFDMGRGLGSILDGRRGIGPGSNDRIRDHRRREIGTRIH
jgi:hypothetical protein